jgi:type I restriction enzyme S subunit
VIARLRPYPEYKDSGVEWFGQIPAGWEVRRQRTITELRVSNVDKHVLEHEHPIRLCNYVDVYSNDRIVRGMTFSPGTANAAEIDRFRLQTGDVLITKDSESWDDIAIPALVETADPDLVCGYHLAILRPGPKVTGGFLLRAHQAESVARQYRLEAKGVTRFGLTHGAIGSIRLPLPSLRVQAAIVAFLDHFDSRFQRFIGAKERLIGLLDEEKQALIHRAVTRGLDPNTPLKPSGIEWLGEIPRHWDAMEVRRLGRIIGGMTPRMDRAEFWNGDVPWVSPKDMKSILIESSEDHVTRRALRETAIRVVPTGAVLIVVRGMILARRVPIAQTSLGVTINQDLKAVVPDGPVSGEFLSLALRAAQAPLMGMTDEAGHGTRRLPSERWMRLGLPIPPPHEQAHIIEFVERAAHRANRLSNAARRHISLLRELRSRLIADVITGKLDVREVAATLVADGDGKASPLDEQLEEAIA